MISSVIRNNKESMICLTLKPSPLISKIIKVSLCPPLSSDLNCIDYAIRGILENKTNATSHSNIGLLKTAIKKEWNKMYEEFIFTACKSF